MATKIKLIGPPAYYKDGVSDASPVVGIADGVNRVARYTFTAPAVGATSVEVYLPYHSLGSGSGTQPALRFYIGLDASDHANAGSDASYTADLVLDTKTWNSYSGSAQVTLLPSKTYYLWVFPSTTKYGWWHWNGYAEDAAITVDGAAASVIKGDNGTLGENHTITTTRYDASFTHTVAAICGEEQLLLVDKTKDKTIVWTPPIDWAAQNTAGTAIVATVRIDTYSGNTLVGSNSITLTFAIPDIVKPSATLTVTDGAGHLSKYGYYIQGKSKAAVTVTASGAYGSEVKSIVVSCGSLSGTGDKLSFDLPDAGQLTVAATVTDSRGRSFTTFTVITVTAYTPPMAVIITAYRSDAQGNEDPDGAYATVAFNASVVPLDGKNTANYTLQYRQRKATSWISAALSDLEGSYSVTGAKCTVAASTERAFEFCIVPEDDFGSVPSSYRIVQIAFSLADFDRLNRAIGLGQRASEPGLIGCGLPIALHKGIQPEGTYPGSDNEADLNSWLDTHLTDMLACTMKFVSVKIPPLSGATLYGFLVKNSQEYAFLILWTYGSYYIHKIKQEGTWNDATKITL